MTTEIVKADFQDIFKDVAGSEHIKNYEFSLDDISTKEGGIISAFITGEILNKDSGRTTKVAIKKAINNGYSADIENKPLFVNEINFYSKVFPELDKFQREKGVSKPFDNIAKYFAGSVITENMFVAMENLKSAGYVLFDKRKYLDKAHLETVFKTYGKFHALSFVFKQEKPESYKNLLKDSTDIFNGELLRSGDIIDYLTETYFSALKTLDPVNEGDILTKLKKAADVKETMFRVQGYKGNYGCLTHGDCCSNNMLFKYKESKELEDIKIIDFQFLRSSTPIHDLSYFFYAGASKEDMDNLDYYLDLYYQSFSEFAKELGSDPEKLFPFKTLKEEWKTYALFGVIPGLYIWVVKLMDGNEIADLINKENASTEQRMEFWSKRMSEIRDGDKFREIARNICLHLVEYGIL